MMGTMRRVHPLLLAVGCAGFAALRAPPPPSPPPEPPPAAFVVDEVAGTTRLLRAGTTMPSATFARANEQFGDVCIAPDGQRAIARLGERRDRCTLFTAGTAAGRVLVQRWVYDVRWLPPAGHEPRARDR